MNEVTSKTHEIRLFDSQWVNVVNGCKTIEDAVRKTEEYMARNYWDNEWPKVRAKSEAAPSAGKP